MNNIINTVATNVANFFKTDYATKEGLFYHYKELGLMDIFSHPDINDWNEYCEHTADYDNEIYEYDMLDDIMYDRTATEVIASIITTKWNDSDPYIKIDLSNGYWYTLDEYDFDDLINEADDEFWTWYFETHIDEDLVDEIIDVANKMIDDNKEKEVI